MTKDLNISVLVAARDEYIEQLKCILSPLLIQGFNSIYQDAITLSGNKKTIIQFQKLLKDIPGWNQTILQEESKRIKKKCPYLMDIVTAIFVTSVKILASVRLKGNRDDIRVKIPTSDIFIHSIYIESAQQIFYDPFLFYHKKLTFGEVQQNKEQVKKIIRNSVDDTIRTMLPLNDILEKYLADTLGDNASVSDDSSDENSQQSFSDEESLKFDESESEEEQEPFEEPPVKTFNLNGMQHLAPPLPPPPQEQFVPPVIPQQIPFVNDQFEQPRRQDDASSVSSVSSVSSRSSSGSSSSSGSRKHHKHHENRENHENHENHENREGGKYSFFN